MYYDFEDYLNNIDFHLSQTQKIFMMEHAQDIINDINLKIQEHSYSCLLYTSDAADE